ncbi:MAG: M1 family metallopeptidase [Bryobacteraceae bacterium]|nr:M1 family metallopeptidase [Bryobacteraceae bacterium]
MKILLLLVAATTLAQTPPTRAEVLRGEYGRYRANNDLLSYHLNVRVDPARKFLSGVNAIRFRMLSEDTRIQLELYANLQVDRIMLGQTSLKYEREVNTVWVDFPQPLKAGRVYTIDFHYSGQPKETGRFGGITFRQDIEGNPWINTACEGEGSSVWWPSKDQWRDEVEGMRLSVAVPDGLMDVSNGKFMGKASLGDGYTRWDWHVHYPINSYNVSLNIGRYVQFSDQFGRLPLDFYVLRANLEKAKRQFAQVKPMLQAFASYFGPYPFPKDGYKLIEVPYSGMEHQSAVTYGNRFANGYLERDWTGVGISLKFDFIIIHESAHEWFGNAVSAADVSDMWIQEGWATYLEGLYVEHQFGYADAIQYLNGYQAKVKNQQPIITTPGLHRSPPGDQYFKGALFINTLRHVVNDEKKWRGMLRRYFSTFRYRNIRTEDVVDFFNRETGMNLTPVFNQYLRHAALPVLNLEFAPGKVRYRWQAEESGFAMPVKVGSAAKWRTIRPTAEWQELTTNLAPADFAVATDYFYVSVRRSEAGNGER